jgi:hypothetical protein
MEWNGKGLEKDRGCGGKDLFLHKSVDAFVSFCFYHEMEIESNIAPPPVRVHQKRITDEIRAMKPGDSFVCDSGMLSAFKVWARYQGWEPRQQKLGDDSYRVWRVS